MHLYETHLPVNDTQRARDFYTETVGLLFAYRDPTRDIIFLWVSEKERGMLEFISLLPDEPRPNFIGTYSEWKARSTTSR
jgi:hypothetical protein